jgi:hypothetical protein
MEFLDRPNWQWMSHVPPGSHFNGDMNAKSLFLSIAAG